MTPIIFMRRAQIAVSGPVAVAGFQTPDLANNLSFETDLHPLLDKSEGFPPTGVSRSTSLAAPGGGSASLQYAINPNVGDTAASCMLEFAGHSTPFLDRVWVRFYFRFTVKPDSHFKWCRWYDSPSFNDSFGGLFVAGGITGISWVWDTEDASRDHTCGPADASIYDSNWHWVEFDYWRNGDPSGWPSVALWFDGSPLTKPDGTTGVTSFWQSGRLYAGERLDSTKMGVIDWFGTLNGGNTATGQLNTDLISVSTLGRIGP